MALFLTLNQITPKSYSSGVWILLFAEEMATRMFFHVILHVLLIVLKKSIWGQILLVACIDPLNKGGCSKMGVSGIILFALISKN